MSDERSETETAVKVALLSGMAKNGASDGQLMEALAQMDGEAIIPVWDANDERVMVRVARVHCLNYDADGLCTLYFNGVSPMDPRYSLKLGEVGHKVVRRLREAGWEH